MEPNRRIYIEIAIAVALTALIIFLTHWHFNNQFQVLYSLDAYHNDQAIISVIDHAKKYVYFAIYTFTQNDIADALIRAQKRGLVVWGITDAQQATIPQQSSILEHLAEAGITVETQKHPDGIMHIKAVVTDRQYASGSYNWTESATDVNDEVLEVSSNEHLREQYLAIIKKVLLINQ